MKKTSVQRHSGVCGWLSRLPLETSGLTFHIYSKYNLQSLILPGDKRLQPCCVPLTSVSLCDGQRLMRSLCILDMLHLSGEFVFSMISSRYLFFCSACTGWLLLFGEPQWWGHVAVPPTVNLRQTYYRNSQKYIHSNWLSTSRDIAHQWLITAGKLHQNILISALMMASCRHGSVPLSANELINGNIK